jgi:hypothetical protein
VDSTQISRIIMFILAGTILFFTAVVLVFKGIDDMPHHYIGLAFALVLSAGALAMTRIH